MSTTVEIIGRSGGTAGRRRVYAVWGVASEAAALSAVAGAILDELGNLGTLDGFALRSLDYDELSADDAYTVTAGWGAEGAPQPPETNSFSISFDFAAQAQKVVLPINPIRVYGPSGLISSPDPPVRMIGDRGDGEQPEGVEVYEPFLTFSETQYKPGDFVTTDYLRLLRRLIGRTNNASWRGFEEGELMAMGVSGARRSIRDDWELQFKFAAREHQTDVVVAGITVAVKRGWEFLWPQVARGADTTDHLTVQRVKRICVTNPFRTADYTLFGIGE